MCVSERVSECSVCVCVGCGIDIYLCTYSFRLCVAAGETESHYTYISVSVCVCLTVCMYVGECSASNVMPCARCEKSTRLALVRSTGRRREGRRLASFV